MLTEAEDSRAESAVRATELTALEELAAALQATGHLQEGDAIPRESGRCRILDVAIPFSVSRCLRGEMVLKKRSRCQCV